jgi:hypothetical protein
MRRALVVAVALGMLAPNVANAQSKAPSGKNSTALTMTGCVSAKPDASGRYTFEGADGVSKFQLTGRRLARWAGQRVELVGGSPDGGGLAIRGGLVGPQAGARGVALDPAQESIRRQPGGGGTESGPRIPSSRCRA